MLENYRKNASKTCQVKLNGDSNSQKYYDNSISKWPISNEVLFKMFSRVHESWSRHHGCELDIKKHL